MRSVCAPAHLQCSAPHLCICFPFKQKQTSEAVFKNAVIEILTLCASVTQNPFRELNPGSLKSDHFLSPLISGSLLPASALDPSLPRKPLKIFSHSSHTRFGSSYTENGPMLSDYLIPQLKSNKGTLY